ncbi:MAG: aspartyl protease family protein [Candidatus Bathyarchaeia archaeon]
MGDTFVDVDVHGDRGSKVLEKVLVDTGATKTVIDPRTAKEVGVQIISREEVDVKGQPVWLDQGFTRIRLQAVEGVVPVWVSDVTPPVIGVTTLETLGFKVNPVTGKLEKTRPRL